MSFIGMETKIECVFVYIFIHISFLLLFIPVKLLYNEE